MVLRSRLRQETAIPATIGRRWGYLPQFDLAGFLLTCARVIADHADLSRQVIAAAIDVHHALGPGLLESAYAKCLAVELADRNVPFEREVSVPVFYKNRRIDHGFRADFVVDGRLLVEIKCARSIHPVYRAQVITYLKLLDLSRALLINFHVRRLVDGVSSVVGSRHEAEHH